MGKARKNLSQRYKGTETHEKKQDLLVPKNEQPYAVPKNWVWTRLLSVFTNMTSSNKKLQQKDYLDIGSFAVVDQGKELIGGYTNDENLLHDDNLPIIVFGDHTRIVKYVDFPFVQGADGVKLLYPNMFVNSKFFYYAIQNIKIPDLGYRRHYPLFPQFYFPLPPQAEQQRIVNRIESLFGRLEHAKVLAQNAIDNFENRKAAILHKAFTGELTTKWRKENGVRLESWKKKTVSSACLDIKVGIVIKPSQYYVEKGKGTPAFRSANVREFHIDNFDWVYLSEQGQRDNQRSIVHTGDVLVVRSGNPGISCVVTNEFDGYNAIDILIAVPDQKQLDSYYLCAYTNSPMGKQLIFKNKRGMALAHFNVGGYSNLTIPLPSLPEQKEIVRILDGLFEKEQRARELYDVINKIDLMKKAILARAFRGELGTNDPNEESAVQMKF